VLYMVMIQELETIYQWIFLFSSHLREGDSYFHWLRQNGMRVPIGCVMLYACVLSWFSVNASFQRLCLIYVSMTVGVLMEPFPGLQAWQIHGALASFMLWFTLAETAGLVRRALGIETADQANTAPAWRTRTAVLGNVLLYTLPLLYMLNQSRSMLVAARYWYAPEYRLSAQYETFQEFCTALGNETVICVQRNHPIACFDASFLGNGLTGTGANVYSRAVAKIPDFKAPPRDLLADLQKNKPAFTLKPGRLCFATAEEYERRQPELDEFFAAHYEPWKGDLYLLRSSPAKEQLLEVLNSPGGILHLFTALTVKQESVAEVLQSLR
jgi:hypothetical protein